MKWIRKIAAAGCLIFALWFMLPIAIGMVHIGMVYPTVLLLLLAAVLWFWDKLSPILLRHKGWTCVMAILLCVGLLMILIPFGLIVSKTVPETPPKDATVVVLGCQVVGSTPSLILADRCDQAIEYLNAHPDAMCVATGGVGNLADISEAQAIYNYVTARGIDSSRVLLEENATNTFENLAFSAQIIRENHLSADVAIISDGFHQWRASYFAAKNGLTAYAMGCPTAWYMAPGYYAREVLAIYKALILGY